MSKETAKQLHIELWFEGGEKSLEVRHLSVREAISTPFVVSVTARSELATIDLQAIVGKQASLTILHGGEPVRKWKGVCSHIGQMNAMPVAQKKTLSTYELDIVPSLWLLSHRSGHRIYQHLSIPEIADKLLAEWSIEPTWKIVRAAYPKLEYRVQHGESDYDFLSRLLEEAGIAVTFPDHGGQGTKLTLDDNLSGAAPRPGEPIPFGDNANRSPGKEHVTEVRLLHQVRPGKVTLRDYDFRKPRYELSGRAKPEAPAPESKYERYRYDAGAFVARGAAGGDTPVADKKGIYRADEKRGGDLATRTLEAIRADKRIVAFGTNVVDLAPGVIFSIDGHPHPDIESGKLLVTEMAVSGAPGGDWTIEGMAVFADAKAPYRPPHKTPKQAVLGLECAIVVGPPGQEIHADELGRVRVQFPWDREGKWDDDTSCWMRVSQGWAGRGFGMFTIPRVGQEVLVAFLDGDPDQPLIVGRAFNAQEVVPYKLPENQTVSTWKSQSTPGGQGFNEIKFEDKEKLELVYMQAERDRNTLVKRDEVERVGRDRRVTIGPALGAGAAQGASPALGGGDDDLVVRGVRKTLVHKDDHVHVKMRRLEKIDGAVSLTVGANRDERVLGSHALEAGQTIHVKAGMTMVIEAGARLTIKSSGGFIDINPDGIDIVGLVVNINSGGEAGMGPGARPTLPSDADEARPKDTSTP